MCSATYAPKLKLMACFMSLMMARWYPSWRVLDMASWPFLPMAKIWVLESTCFSK